MRKKAQQVGQQARARLSYLARALELIWEAAPGWTVIWAVLLILQGILPAASVYLTRELVDGLVLALDSGGAWEAVRPALIAAVLMAAIILLTEVLQSVNEWIATAQAEHVQDHIKELIYAKSTTVDLAFYESPDFFDHLHRALSDASARPLALLNNMGTLLQNLVTLLSLVMILVSYGWWFPVILVGSTLPALYVVLFFNRRYHQWWEETTVDRRWLRYYDLMLTGNSNIAAEVRLFDLGNFLRDSYRTLRYRLRDERIALVRQQSLGRLGAGLLTVAGAGAVMALMGWRALQGLATLGDLALFYQAFSRGQSLARSLLRSIGQIYSDSLFLGNLFEFLSLEPEVNDPPQPLALTTPLTDAIRFENITFRYPGSERAVLEDFSLTVPAGKIVAIVGTNGAGKTTLLKLLCRFYDPDRGRITFDSTDIRNFTVKQLRQVITVLFQLPINHYATARTNIAVGDLASEPTDEAVELAARGAGAHDFILRLPEGYNTLLGKWFGKGTELSGGEWQRLALARAFLKKADVLILDEPTSFMDSWAEADWVRRFRQLVEGKTGVIITHRFTTAMRADIIHVMDRGEIVESGTHDELLALGGRYAISWKNQTESQGDSEVASSPNGTSVQQVAGVTVHGD